MPTHNHGPLLQVSVNSALRQTVTDIEVFIVLDGPTPATREAALALQDSDERVRLFDNPKGARHGELHRHQALSHASGDIVCYLSDDDLWLPDHVAGFLNLLSEADFAHSLPTWVTTEDTFGVWTVELASEFYRTLLLGGTNRIPLTTAAHTLALYHRLPHGWRTSPDGTPTDLYMWQQILAMDDVRAASGTAPTALSFPAPHRADMTQDERLIELQKWEKRLQGPPGRSAVRAEVLDVVARNRAHVQARLEKEAHLRATLQKEAHHFETALAEAADNELRATQEIAALSLRNERLVAQHDDDQLHLEAARLEREQLVEAQGNAERQLRSLRSSATWRLRNALIRVPGLETAYKGIARGHVRDS